jgi:hypothetical protein
MWGGNGRLLVFGLALGGWCTTAFVVLTLPVAPPTQAVFYAAAFAALAGTWALARELYHARRQSNGMGPGAIALLSSGIKSYC